MDFRTKNYDTACEHLTAAGFIVGLEISRGRWRLQWHKKGSYWEVETGLAVPHCFDWLGTQANLWCEARHNATGNEKKFATQIHPSKKGKK